MVRALTIGLLLLSLSLAGCGPEPDRDQAAAAVTDFISAVASLDAEGLSAALQQDVGEDDASFWAETLLGTPYGCSLDAVDVGEPIEAEGGLGYLVRVQSPDVESGEVHVTVVVEPVASKWVVRGATGMGPSL